MLLYDDYLLSSTVTYNHAGASACHGLAREAGRGASHDYEYDYHDHYDYDHYYEYDYDW